MPSALRTDFSWKIGAPDWRRAARRLLRPLALLALVAVVAAQSPVHAQDEQSEETPDDSQSGDTASVDPQSDAASEGESDPVADYFIGNMLFIFYHELGHGLIDKLDAPVLGREEDAADQLATLMMMDTGADSVGGEPVLTAALGWLEDWRKRDNTAEDADYFDEHSLTYQRYANIVCLVYGSDPERYSNMIDDWSLPAERAESCPADYNSTLRSWDRIAETALTSEDEPAPAGNASFTLEVLPAESEDTKPAAEYTAQLGIFPELVKRLNEHFVLPSPIKVVVSDCGVENAFYTAETSEISMCYEWLATFLADAQQQSE